MLSPDKIIEALERIHAVATDPDVEGKILTILSEVFAFNYLMLASRVFREGEIWFEGRCCDEQCPEGLVKATKRLCKPGDPEEDILCHVARAKEIVRVDPADPSDPLRGKLHRETTDAFGFNDPIYFIPLLDRQKDVRAVIHASEPRGSLNSNNPSFLRWLSVLARNAGMAIENAELHRRLDLVSRQRALLAEISATTDKLDALDDKILNVLTTLTCGVGLRYNRAFLFRREPSGEFVGVWGVAPRSIEEFRKIAEETEQWTWSEYTKSQDAKCLMSKWPNQNLRAVRLTLGTGSPAATCVDSRGIVRREKGDVPMDPAMLDTAHEGFFIRGAPYVLVPLHNDILCVGILYLDKAYSREELGDDATLSLVRSQLTLLFERDQRKRDKQAITNIFSSLLEQVAKVASTGDPLHHTLFESINRAAAALGAKSVCVALQEASALTWKFLHKHTFDDNPVDWQKWLLALSKEDTNWVHSKEYTVPDSSERRTIVAAFIPFSFEYGRYAFCIDCSTLRGADPQIVQTWSTIAIFASASLALSENANFHTETFANLLENGPKLFASNIYRLTAHEARNVLSALLLAVEHVNSGRVKLPSKERREFQLLEERVEAGVVAMDTYVEFLEDFDQHGGEDSAWSDPRKLAREVVLLLAPRIVAMGKIPDQVFSLQLDNIELKIDRPNLTIVLHNLISNAIKAVRDIQNPKICVEASLIATNKAHLRVIDNGCGLTADDRKYILKAKYSGFSRRYQSDKTRQFNKSSGIGLLGLRMIVEREFGGSIQLNSHGGKTEALVILPARKNSAE